MQTQSIISRIESLLSTIRGLIGVGGAPVSAENPAPVTGPLTDNQLRATPVPVTGAVTGPLTDAQLRAAVVPVTPSAQEIHLGEVSGNTIIKDVVLSLDTNAYAIGDVLAATQEITAAMRVVGGKGILQSVQVNGKDDQGQAFDLVFLKTNVSIGTENAACSISDDDADQVLGIVRVLASDLIDVGGCRLATITPRGENSPGFVLESAADSTSIFVAAISQGTGTYTASGITLKLGILRD